MKIRRLSAPNIRDAMRRVREELGPEAVILSNRRVSSGVEIVAAVDYDESLVDEEQPETPPAPKPTTSLGQRLGGRAAQAYQDRESQDKDDRPKDRPRILSEAPGSLKEDKAAQPSRSEAAEGPEAGDGKPKVVWSQDPMLVQMQQRIDAVYAMLQQQVSGLAWGEMGRRQPQRADLLARLMDFGLSPELCLELAGRLESGADLEQAWRQALGLLAEALPVADDEILTRGGVVALVGPTGVGKTTTVAKLAARYALRHGPRKVALVTTDSYRIGAYDQLRTFGMILDMPVRLAADH
ncbi:MAG: flagellar biosynthesis protein FlhF, partial [Candidatus Competibacteraceae bacterium]|nr:flagellar biosynthesis protein FlhF [Candidatus Competibacteraceae bacterium]